MICIQEAQVRMFCLQKALLLQLPTSLFSLFPTNIQIALKIEFKEIQSNQRDIKYQINCDIHMTN